jgi:glycosyltransferase involved in cell wall biosynthesis
MRLTADGVTMHFVRSPRRLRAATLFLPDCVRLHRVLRAIRPDLVHAHGTEDAYSLAGLTSGLPCVITMQGMIFRIAERAGDPTDLRTWVLTRLERWCLRRARHIIAKSDHVARCIAPIATHAAFHRIPNAMNPAFFEADDEPVADRLLFAAMIAPVKGLEHLIAALPRVCERRPGARLDIVGVPGRGSEAYLATIQEQVQRLGLAERVKFLGFKRPETLACEMAQASVVVVPSLEEMFCNVAAEAMSVGRPVVASRAGSLPELVADGERGLLVPPADPAALADAVLRLLDDDALRTMLGAAAREWAQQWEPSVVAQQTLAVYEAALTTDSQRR